ncbi:hypothetical protein [Levilactobacillus fujinensis]|uniref:Uncharacterized protein n=1 Tax=Levilactobacillus fujinensis TaxID=2486024 RepID=A0ABW1TF49_9LACO|nr:hypothetical protein [Levilactobacillus fujinensis]
MANSLTHGLTTAYQEKVEAEQAVDFTDLQPADVKIFVPGDQVEIDWSTLLYLKNYSSSDHAEDTVVWTTAGFYRTERTPRALIQSLSKCAGVDWFDCHVEKDFLKLTSPTPFVLGDLLLFATERSQYGKYYSWLNGHYLQSVNTTAQKEESRISLTVRMEMIIRDSTTRLSKSWDDVLQVQRSRQQLVAQFMQTPQAGPMIDRPVRVAGLTYCQYFAKQLLTAYMKKTQHNAARVVDEEALWQVLRDDQRGTEPPLDS